MIGSRREIIQALSKRGRILYSLGLPIRYHDPKLDDLDFNLIERENKDNITPKKQEIWVKKVLTSFKNREAISHSVLLHSRPTDDKAMKVAATILIRALKYGKDVKVVNLGFIKKEEVANIKADVILLYSVTPRTSNWKLDMARDIIRQCDPAFVMLVSSSQNTGDSRLNAYEFNCEYLNFPFNAYLEMD